MKPRGIVILAVAVLLLGYTAGYHVYAASSEPGSEGDPLVSKSYVDKVVSEKTTALEEEIKELKAELKSVKSKLDNIGSTSKEGNLPKQIILQINKNLAVVDGKEEQLEAAPFLSGESTMLPFSFIGEKLGAQVSWLSAEKSVLFQKGNKNIKIKIGSPTATVNGTQVALNSQAVIKDSKTFVPLRFIADHLEAKVNWEKNTKTITIIPSGEGK